MSQDLWKSNSDWFVEWFNTEAYHVLYKHRDFKEASAFTRLISERFFSSGKKRLMDLGCGKGRHAVSLASFGHEVIGVDLSENSIASARTTHVDQSGLSFVRADMRELRTHFEADTFDGVLLLFTSFGYFENDQDHEEVLAQVKQIIRPGGSLLLDYFNLDWVQSQLVGHEQVQRDGWSFDIDRRIHEGWVEKSIRCESDEGVKSHAVERVRAFTVNDLKKMCELQGFEKLEFYGNYQMDDLVDSSPRCILVARK